MDIDVIQKWILVISGAFSMISVGIGVLLAVAQYKLKAKEEKRLTVSSQAEVDVRLTKAFTELMDLAMGRRQHVLSEKAVEELFKHGFISKEDFDENFTKNQVGARKLSEYAVVKLPVGKSGQEAAIAAVATLARRYEVLKDAAICGLESLQNNEDIAGLVRRHLQRARG